MSGMEAFIGVAANVTGIPGVEKILEGAMKEAVALFKLYRSRDGDRKSFALFMSNVARTLEGIKGSVPEHAEAVARELAALVATAKLKCDKYEARGLRSSLLHLGSEAERLQSIMQGVQQLLPLLTVSVASASNVSAAVSGLQRRAASLQDSSADAAAHLSHMSETVSALADSNATRAKIEECMARLHSSMMELNTSSTQKVLEGSAALQQQLADGLDVLLETLDVLQLTFDSFTKQMLTLQRDMYADIQAIKAHLFAGDGDGNAAQSTSMGQGLILTAIDEVIESLDGRPPPSTNEQWAAAIKKAIATGSLTTTACAVLHVPLMHEGPLRPVTLPCCGFVVSHAGARQLVRAGKCQVCKSPLAADADLLRNEAVAAAVRAEGHGFAPRQFKPEEVTIGSRIGSGGEGTVVRGTIRGRDVAVKQVPMPKVVGPKDVAGVRHVISASYIGGVSSPYVCQLHGYCWTDSELWLLLELCDGSLGDLVPTVRQESDLPGLPPVDTATLGLMLCSALDAVHSRARCLHLDITPSNVLLAAPSGTDEPNSQTRSVRLADFGLAKHLPSCVRSSLTAASQPSGVDGVAKGTPGYAPREQLRGKGQRRSDVYSLGATLLYAATGVHPFGGASSESIAFQLIEGTAMTVPEYVTPPALRGLITAMTAVEAESRPALAEVHQRLRGIHSSLLAEGAKNRFITGFPTSHTAVTSHTDASRSSAGHADVIKTATPDPQPALNSLQSLALHSAAESQDGAAVGQPTHQPAYSNDRGMHGRHASDVPSVVTSEVAAPVESFCSGGRGSEGIAPHEPLQPGNAGTRDTDAGLRPAYEAVSGVDSIRTIEDLLANLSTGIPGRILDFSSRTLHLASTQQAAADQYMSNRLPPTAACAQLSQGGGVVVNVTLALGAAPENMLLLRSTSRVEFRTTTIQGGQLHCEGPECKVTLRHAVLENCQLAATAGATVDLHSTQVLPLQLSSVRYLCGMWGKGTTFYANNTVFHGDVRAYGGAAFTGDKVQVRVGNGDTVGAVAMGEGSRVTLRGCDVARSPGAGPGQRVGVCARESAVADLTNCSLRQVYLGVQVASGGCACLRGCKVEAEGDGVWVEGAGSRVQAVGCRVSGRGAALAIAESVVTGNVSFDEQCELGRTRTIVHDGASGGRTTPEEVSQQAQRTGAGGRQKWADWLRR